MTRHSDIDQLAINTIRMLAIDAVQKANSGHPGTPMDAAPTAYVLWQRFLRYDPADPHWLNLLATENIRARVVSMPSWELFDAQDPAYQQSVLPPAVTARVTAEEASPIGWGRYAGPCGVVLGMRSFGMSAPMKIVAEHFGFKAEHVAAAAKSTIRRAAGGTSSQDDRIRS